MISNISSISLWLEKKVPYSLSSRTLAIVPVRRLVGCQSYPAIVCVSVIIMSKQRIACFFGNHPLKTMKITELLASFIHLRGFPWKTWKIVNKKKPSLSHTLGARKAQQEQLLSCILWTCTLRILMTTFKTYIIFNTRVY